MRRLIAILILLAVLAAGAVASASGDEGGGYEVRAIFDNGGFLVPGEDVRIAGAKVGEVSEVGVTLPGDWVNADHSAGPGKAFAVLTIDDAGFQDFRRDASCLIRPQSLLGEKYVECDATQPRAPATTPPPPLESIPDGQPGAGQRFLPLQSNGKQVDLDLVQDIQRLPYAERFRLILNELGAGLAGRGEDLAKVIERADPALRETDQVLAILARQNRQLARLASDADVVVAPLAREREHVAGFIDSANVTAQATAERGRDLAAGIQRLPGFLGQLRSTMVQLRAVADQAQPVFSDLGAAAPDLTRATRALGPFADAAETSLTTLGDAAAESGPKIRASDPVIKDAGELAHSAQSPARNAKRLLSSLRKTGGFKRLMDFIYASTGAINGFDSFGHFVRAELLSIGCANYQTKPLSGCIASWVHQDKAKSPSSMKALETLLDFAVGRQRGPGTGGVSP